MKGEFKINKNTRLLKLYYMLLNGEAINKTAYIFDNQVNSRTFERDIADIRNFLSDIFSNRELYYDKKSDVYYLTGSLPSYMDRTDALIISKILIDSQILRRDELDGLIQKILLNTQPYEVTKIKEYLNKDFDFYESKTNVPILKMIDDLNTVIEYGCDIEYTNINGDKKVISPIKIELTTANSKLLASNKIEREEYIEIDIAEIERFKILNTYYAKTIQEKYYKERWGNMDER